VNRIRQTLVAPSSAFVITDNFRQSLPPGVLESQILPQLNNIVNNPGRLNFFEPRRTFRFTVSRTF